MKGQRRQTFRDEIFPAGALRDRGGPHPHYVFRGGRGLV